ncbi:hypothetical protein [Helicobacter cetorum]|uniref:hypothetical protein n=1 Tax=Helicobacter cetorum TaxID=138563 RepID=UPI000CF0E897|nr:hypothetical protein [Helicobacter cetorum]
MRLKYQGLKNEVFLRVLRYYSTLKDAPKSLGAKAQRSILNSNLNPKKEKLKYNERQGLLRGFAISSPLYVESPLIFKKKGRNVILSQNPKTPLITLFQTLKKNNPLFLNETFKRVREVLNPKQRMLSLLNNRGLV